MKKIKSFSLLILFYLNIGQAFGQDFSNTFIYPSMKDIDLIVKSKVVLKNELFIYNYTIICHESNAQSVDGIMIDRLAEVEKMSAPYLWRALKSKPLNTYEWWTADSNYYINPSETKMGFILESKELPSILKYYATGYVPLPVFPLGQEPEKIVNSGIENSKQGYTIGPANPPDPFVSESFADTLLSYISQSLNLGWINDSSTANKYTSYLINAKQKILQGNNNLAIKSLDSVLTDVDIDSSTALSSEAYALIKYNTKYLKDQLLQSSGPTNYNVILKNSLGQLLPGGSLKYYEGGWKEAIDNGDGTFQVNTDKSSITPRMTYATAGNQIEFEVKAKVKILENDLLNFIYSLHNLNNSQQDIWYFKIILDISPNFIKEKFIIPGWWQPTIPPDPPYWVGWGASAKNNIIPGDSITNFGFITSKIYCIGISTFYAEGRHPIPKFEEGTAPELVEGYSDITPYGPGVICRTIGPSAIPDLFIPETFADTLLSYTNHSLNLNWISNSSIANKYSSYFTNAKQKISQGNNNLAIKSLDSVLTDVDIDSSTALSSEAYALIKYNTEYLKKQLLQSQVKPFKEN